MEMIYGVHKKPTFPVFPQYQLSNSSKRPSICVVSTRNSIAYTTETEITEADNNLFSGFYVYVADLNAPWLSYKVTSNKFPVSILQWDVQGKYLLIGDISGNIQIWIQKDNLLSEWIQLYHCRLPGEHIIKAVFFHNGKRLAIQNDKKDITNYMEKFQRTKFAPSVRSFGGVPADGVLLLTATGLLGTFLIPSETPNYSYLVANQAIAQLPFTLLSTTCSLGQTRTFNTAADISYGKNGSFLIAVANGTSETTSSTMIHCYRVTVKKQADNLSINSHTLPSFFLASGAGRDIPDLKVTHLKWAQTEDAESLLVGTKYLSGCFLETWRLVEKATPIHSHFKHMFQQSNKTEVFKTMVWNHQSNYQYTSNIVDICSSKFQYGSYNYLFISMADNSIHLLSRDTLKRITTASISSVWRNDNDHSSKQIRLDTKLAAHDISHMGHFLMAIDAQGQLYVYRITYPHQEPMSGQQCITYTISLLEYCLFGNFDALDIFLTLKVQQLETIIDRLSENFNRQPSHIQQFCYVNFLALKTNLYRLSVSGQSKAHDLTSLLMLHSILIAFKSLLRPSDLTSHDKGPAEDLAMVLSESVPDIDKVLIGLEPKDFTVEPSTLQSLQQLIQWVADLALNILAKLPDNRAMAAITRNTGYDISKDIVAINSIRELLVMMRIWGLLRPQCLPIFARSADNLDILATLFRLLTRLALNPNEPDEMLLDECCLLPSQVLIPQLQFTSSQYSVASPIIFMKSTIDLPLNFEYNTEPQCLKFNPDIPAVEGALSNDNMVDSVRHIQLGKRPASLRRCTRCGACSSVASVYARTPAMRAWEQRWASGCRCGGFWRLQVLA